MQVYNIKTLLSLKAKHQWSKWWLNPIANIKIHSSVSCSLRKRGACKQSKYIDRNNKIAIFTHS